MSKQRTRTRFAVGMVCALAAWFAMPVAPAMAGDGLVTEYVVIVCVDGIRNSEGLKNPDASPLGQTPSTHPYLPRIWSEIAPFATVYNNAKTNEASYTTPGFNTILSGVWQFGPNRSRREGVGFFDNRSDAPTIFEYFNDATGRTAWGVINKKNSLLSDFSIHPLFGRSKLANFIFIDPGRGANRFESDQEVYDNAIQIFESHEPDLMFINFGAVDLAGHSRSWPTYEEIVRVADQHVANVWDYLQSSPKYQGKTTMILTTDHGRHLDEYGGFTSHGGMCDGCRDLCTLVIGPDTPAQVVDRRVYQVDFAPTVGRLMGLETLISDGRILAEALGEVPQEQVVYSCRPQVASEGEDNVFLSYLRTRNGKKQVHVAVSRDQGETFSDAFNLTTYGSDPYDFFAKDQRLLVNRRNARDMLQVIWLDLKDAEGRWQMRHRMADLTPFQQGASLEFGEERVIGDSLFEGQRQDPLISNAGVTLQFPSIVSGRGPNGRREIIASAGQRYTMGFRFSDSAFSDGGQGNTQSSYPQERYFFLEPHLAAGDRQDVYVVWRDILKPVYVDINGDGVLDPLHNWEIYFAMSLDGGENWTPRPVRLTRSASPSLHPRVALAPMGGLDDGLQVLVAYADQDANGIYQIYLRRGLFLAPDRVEFTQPVALTESTIGAWRPELVVGRPISGSGIHVVYTDFEYGKGDIFYRYSTNGDDFTPALNVSSSSTISDRASITVLDDEHKFVAWEEVIETNGRTAIRSKSFSATAPVITE